MKLTLGSTSPRRKELLEQVGFTFSIRTPDVDESKIKTRDPIEKVSALVKLKAAFLPFLSDDEVIITADTVVSYKQIIFGKPNNKQEAFTMLQALSGQTHVVYTGVLIRSKTKQKLLVERTEVTFFPLTKAEIDTYIETDDPYDKAGGYGIQGYAARFVEKINGDYTTVVGLPVGKLCRALVAFEAEFSTD